MHLTTIVHPGYLGELDILGTQGLPWVEVSACQLVHTHSMYSVLPFKYAPI